MTQASDRATISTPKVTAINDKDIKFLAAGEKINDIETAVRELVENSIDAQAKIIEVRLTKYGVEAIEVEDNGFGIDEQNFDKLAVRYHTSKIRDYKDLQESLHAYGFRGEALSCLCNLANVTIITKTKSASTGCKLTCKKDGTFTRVPTARDTGTTVVLKNLFHSLPVRKHELERNRKKQYDKVVKLLYEQALARPHIKFSLCKKVGARKEKDFTHGGTSLEGCLITIFGIKILDTLLGIRQPGLEPTQSCFDNSKSLQIFEDRTEDDSNDCREDNLAEEISSQSSRDINGLAKITNESHMSNDFSVCNSKCNNDPAPEASSSQSGQVDACSQEPSKFYKRRSKSKYSREKVQFTIHGYISKIGCGRNSTDSQYIFVNKKPCDIPKVARLINDIYRNYNQSQQYPFYCLFVSVQNFAADFNVPRKRAVILQEEGKLLDLLRECLEKMYAASAPATQTSCPNAKIPFAPQAKASMSRDQETPIEKYPDATGRVPDPPVLEPQVQYCESSPDLILGMRLDDVADDIRNLYEVAPKRARTTVTPDSRPPLRDNTSNNRTTNMPGFQNSYDLFNEQNSGANTGSFSNSPPGPSAPNSPIIGSRRPQKSPQKRKSPSTPVHAPPCHYRQDELLQDEIIKVYINNMQDLDAAIECDRIDRLPQQDTKEFSFAIHPNFNRPAEDELKLNLSKTSFIDMQVIGQFNCGFILTRLNKHIFIIDQHAADERANFEEQLDLCPMVKQRMANPQPLYLNLIQENAIINNMSEFNRHGFEFIVDTTKSVGYRVIQSSTSISRESGRTEHLGKADIEELIDVAIECPSSLSTHTLKKVKNLAASIACRRSVMIGDKLNSQQMLHIVNKLSNLKNPWVCAHNRPTIRHLMDTDWNVFNK